ncbi:alanine--tRNA ligase, partial [Candidatus Woesearchaeota archaeon]
MKSDKLLKSEYKHVFSKTPEQYYPVGVLKAMGFGRAKCKKCGKFFWAIDKSREVCGDATCSGGYEFLKRKITEVELSYEDVWREFKKLFVGLGYKSLRRYPVVARWRDDTLYVKASIYDFQPHVTSGLSPPPAKKVVVPQPCLRFNDIDNVGITMSHMTGFVMIGQHAFMSKEEWSQEELFKDICKWIFDVLKIPKE